jgi:hypothetical protein
VVSNGARGWDGPGPKAVAKKTVVYVANDMRNGGVAHGLKGDDPRMDLSRRRPGLIWGRPQA